MNTGDLACMLLGRELIPPLKRLARAAKAYWARVQAAKLQCMEGDEFDRFTADAKRELEYCLGEAMERCRNHSGLVIWAACALDECLRRNTSHRRR